jgi:hypothetical protein
MAAPPVGAAPCGLPEGLFRVRLLSGCLSLADFLRQPPAAIDQRATEAIGMFQHPHAAWAERGRITAPGVTLHLDRAEATDRDAAPTSTATTAIGSGAGARRCDTRILTISGISGAVARAGGAGRRRACARCRGQSARGIAGSRAVADAGCRERAAWSRRSIECIDRSVAARARGRSGAPAVGGAGRGAVADIEGGQRPSWPR